MRQFDSRLDGAIAITRDIYWVGFVEKRPVYSAIRMS